MITSTLTNRCSKIAINIEFVATVEGIKNGKEVVLGAVHFTAQVTQRLIAVDDDFLYAFRCLNRCFLSEYELAQSRKCK